MLFKKHDIRLYSKAGFKVRIAIVSSTDPLETCEQCGVSYECIVKCVGWYMWVRQRDP